MNKDDGIEEAKRTGHYEYIKDQDDFLSDLRLNEEEKLYYNK